MLRDIYSIFLDECDVCWSERDSDQNTWSQKNSDGLFMEKKLTIILKYAELFLIFLFLKRGAYFITEKKTSTPKKFYLIIRF
jgi:hypothetical protein